MRMSFWLNIFPTCLVAGQCWMPSLPCRTFPLEERLLCGILGGPIQNMYRKCVSCCGHLGFVFWGWDFGKPSTLFLSFSFISFAGSVLVLCGVSFIWLLILSWACEASEELCLQTYSSCCESFAVQPPVQVQSPKVTKSNLCCNLWNPFLRLVKEGTTSIDTRSYIFGGQAMQVFSPSTTDSFCHFRKPWNCTPKLFGWILLSDSCSQTTLVTHRISSCPLVDSCSSFEQDTAFLLQLIQIYTGFSQPERNP